MLKKILIIIVVVTCIAALGACTKYYNIKSVDGELNSVDVSELDKEQRELIKQYADGEIELFEVVQSGEFTALELAEIGLMRFDEVSGEPVLEGGMFTGVYDVDPDLLIRVISGNASEEDMEELYASGMNDEDIRNFLPSSSNAYFTDKDNKNLPPSD